MPTHDYVPHAPGYVDNDGPKIVTKIGRASCRERV